MSTDDLTRRARAEILVLNAVPNDQAVYTQDLLSELADEVDRLRATEGVCTHQNGQYLAMKAETDSARGEADRYRTLRDRHGKNDLLAERDAARAALERVRAVTEDGDRLDGLWTYAPDLARALEGSAEAPRQG